MTLLGMGWNSAEQERGFWTFENAATQREGSNLTEGLAGESARETTTEHYNFRILDSFSDCFLSPFCFEYSSCIDQREVESRAGIIL